jgi:tetratricopeptide (TPR) repeat protein
VADDESPAKIDAMKNWMIALSAVCLVHLAATPVVAQKVDPLTGQVVEQAPPPEPEGPDLTEAYDRVKAQDFKNAEGILAGLQEAWPDDERLLALRGELLVALGRTAEAVPILRKVAAMAPERPRVHFQLGTALASGGDRAAAIAAFGKELEYSEEAQVRLLAHLNRSLLFQQERQLPEAAAELHAVLELDPARLQAWGDLTTLYLEAGDIDNAAAVFKEGYEAGHRSARHGYSVGARLFKAERFAEAIELFVLVLDAEPTHARAVRSLAASMEKTGNQQGALDQWARYLELAPGAADADQVLEKLKAAGKR